MYSGIKVTQGTGFDLNFPTENASAETMIHILRRGIKREAKRLCNLGENCRIVIYN
jgi:hypothetical protein